MKKSIRVFAPASVANLSAGYDVIGLALESPGDEVIMTKNDTGKVQIKSIEGDDGLLPKDPKKNIVSAVVIDYLQTRKLNFGVDIYLFKKMPFNSGLGSSSASSAAGIHAINALVDDPWTKDQLLPFAIRGEMLASGSEHADNIAPALFGGVQLISSYRPLNIIALPYPDNLYISLLYTDISIPTKEARQLIKPKVLMKDAVTQWGNLGGLVAGFFKKDINLISSSMTDVIVEPVRSMLIPHFYHLKDIALKNGGLAYGISGSGPTVFAISDNENDAHNIIQHWEKHHKQKGLKTQSFVSKVNSKGAQII